MKIFFTLMIFCIAIFGCSNKPGPQAESAPLSYSEWEKLPIEAKYEIATLERLRESDPKFQDPQVWKQFLDTRILPLKKKELPGPRN